jgi:hypothetical protein
VNQVADKGDGGYHWPTGDQKNFANRVSNITNDEKQKENCAAHQFFSSLLDPTVSQESRTATNR